MNITRSLLLLAILSPAHFLMGAGVAPDITPSTALTTKATGDVTVGIGDTWAGVKDCSYEKRDEFAASLDRMAAKLEAAFRTLNDKLADQPDTPTKDRIREGKEFSDASTELKFAIANLRACTADSWAETKQKVTESWQRVQAAYDKLKADPVS